MRNTDLSPEQAAIEYDRAVQGARYRIHYRIDDVPLCAVAFTQKGLREVLRELRDMGAGAVAVTDRRYHETRIMGE